MTTARNLSRRATDFVSVKDFGAKGDGSTDDTAAIQAAITTAEARATTLAVAPFTATNGCVVLFPPGTYKTTASLIISRPAGVAIKGFSRGMSRIALAVNDRPVLIYNDCTYGYAFKLEDISIGFATASTQANTAAVGIRFKTGAGVAGYGYYNFTFRNVDFLYCYDCISNVGEASPPNVWGWTWQDMSFYSFSRSALQLTNVGTGGGFPRCRAVNWVLQAQGALGALTYSSPLIYCDAVDGWTMDGIEILNFAMNSAGVISIAGARNINISNVRMESASFTTTAIQAIVFLQGVRATVFGVTCYNQTINAGVTTAIVRCGTNAYASLRSVQVGSISGTGTLTGPLEGVAGQFIQYDSFDANVGSWVATGYASPQIQVLTDSVSVQGFLRLGAAQLRVISGTGTPEGAVTAPVGSIFLRSDGGAGTSFYVKQSGTGNTGWVGK